MQHPKGGPVSNTTGPAALAQATFSGVDLTSLVTTNEPGRYDLGNLGTVLDTADLSPSEIDLLKIIDRDRIVLFDWGLHLIFVPLQPCTLDRENSRFVLEGGLDPDNSDNWRSIDGERLVEILDKIYTGGAPVTTADLIVCLELSGITVDLIGCKNYGPEDPDGYMKELRDAFVTPHRV